MPKFFNKIDPRYTIGAYRLEDLHLLLLDAENSTSVSKLQLATARKRLAECKAACKTVLEMMIDEQRLDETTESVIS